MHSLYVYRFFAQLRMTGQKESKRKAKRCRALKKRWRGLLATSGVGCMASVYIHIGNANIHIGNVNIRIGSHVRTHWSTRTYALSNTDVRIGLYIYMYRVRLRHILHQDLIRLPPPVFAGVQNFGWKPKVQKRGCVKTEMVYLFVKMIALSTFWHTL